jgi:hypothetical protein
MNSLICVKSVGRPVRHLRSSNLRNRVSRARASDFRNRPGALKAQIEYSWSSLPRNRPCWLHSEEFAMCERLGGLLRYYHRDAA